MAEKTMIFPIMNRTLKGIQSLSDNYSGDGEENQTQFITDLSTNLEVLKNQDPGIDEDAVKDIVDGEFDDHLGPDGDIYDRDAIDGMFEDLPSNTWNVMSVRTLPQNPSLRTIYLIQGVVVVH